MDCGVSSVLRDCHRDQRRNVWRLDPVPEVDLCNPASRIGPAHAKPSLVAQDRDRKALIRISHEPRDIAAPSAEVANHPEPPIRTEHDPITIRPPTGCDR